MLFVNGFAPGAAFEGQLVGAIERIERGGTLHVLDVLFVMRGTDSAGLDASGDLCDDLARNGITLRSPA